MHEEPLVPTRPPRAPLERLEPRTRLLCLIVWAACLVSAPPGAWKLLGAYAAMLAALLVSNRKLLPGCFRRVAVPSLFLLVLGAALALLADGGAVWWRFGFLRLTRGGVETAARLVGVGWLCIWGVGLVWSSLERSELLHGLRGIGLPAVFVQVLGFMLRYLDVLRPELHRLSDARAARTVGTGGPGAWRSGCGLIGTLFLRAYDRSGRVADAMAARGYTGRPVSLRKPHWHTLDLAAGGGFLVLVVLLRVGLGGA